MTLIDTNVFIYARNENSDYWEWAEGLLTRLVDGNGAAINAISLAELCVGATDPDLVESQILAWGIEIVDVPAAAAIECASAYRLYRRRRFRDSGKSAPDVPLPDFFIGAHAMVMGWEIATADRSRFSTYFPSVALKLPE